MRYVSKVKVTDPEGASRNNFAGKEVREPVLDTRKMSGTHMAIIQFEEPCHGPHYRPDVFFVNPKFIRPGHRRNIITKHINFCTWEVGSPNQNRQKNSIKFAVVDVFSERFGDPFNRKGKEFPDILAKPPHPYARWHRQKSPETEGGLGEPRGSRSPFPGAPHPGNHEWRFYRRCFYEQISIPFFLP